MSHEHHKWSTVEWDKKSVDDEINDMFGYIDSSIMTMHNNWTVCFRCGIDHSMHRQFFAWNLSLAASLGTIFLLPIYNNSQILYIELVCIFKPSKIFTNLGFTRICTVCTASVCFIKHLFHHQVHAKCMLREMQFIVCNYEFMGVLHKSFLQISCNLFHIQHEQLKPRRVLEPAFSPLKTPKKCDF